MCRITHEQLEMLAQERDDPCISLFVPLDRDALRDDRNRLRLQGVLEQAEQELALRGFPPGGLDRLIAPVREILTSAAFWGERGCGLAVFASPQGTWAHSLRARLPQLVVVGARFHLKPLLSILADSDDIREKAIDRIEQWMGTDRASGDLRQIVPAACNSRIDTLVVSGDVAAWGTFDRTDEKIALRRAAREPGDEDLLNIAAIESLLSGATVRVVDREDVPGVTLAAAVFRYPRTGPDAPGSPRPD